MVLRALEHVVHERLGDEAGPEKEDVAVRRRESKRVEMCIRHRFA